MYRSVDAALMRSATEPLSAVFPVCPDLGSSTAEDVVRQREWMRRVWHTGTLAAAVEVASPALARQIQHVLAGQSIAPRALLSLMLTLLRYLLRSTTRATPFGLFAGVRPAQFGPPTSNDHDIEYRAWAQVDAEWLNLVVRRLEAEPAVLRILPVVANNLVFVRNERLVIACQGDSRTTEVSVRFTEPVQTAINAATTPVPMEDLIDKVAAGYPTAFRARVEALLVDLVNQRALLTTLRPPMTSPDPLGHVLAELSTSGARELPEAAELVRQMEKIHSELSEHNNADSPAAQRELRAVVSTRITSVHRVDRPLAVDLRPTETVTLPEQIAREAESATATLARLNPYPSGPPAWQDYHSRFLEHYGLGALVPLTELVHSDTGLGFPSGYQDSQLPSLPRAPLSDRDTVLLGLAQTAALERRREIILGDQSIQEISATGIGQVQPHTELRVRIHASTMQAITCGDWELAVVGVSRAGGATIGRFLHLLDTTDRVRTITGLAGLPTSVDGALPVQVSCPPLRPRAENISRHPVVLPHLIGLEIPDSENGEQIPLDDLAVTADRTRLYLMSRNRQRVLEPTVFSAIEFTRTAHPLLRFLCEISTAASTVCVPFSWGAAERLPFLPRLRYGRAILTPARWTLTSAHLPPRTAARSLWTNEMTRWRIRFDVPHRVYLGEDDRRIMLDLDDPAHLHLLRSDLDRAGHATIREAPPPDAFGWCGGRAHEITVPLAAAGPARPVPELHHPALAAAAGPPPSHLPGDPTSNWLQTKLYTHPDRHTAVLTIHLPRLLSAFDTAPLWWFIRYRDPQPHLRLRIQLPDADSFAPTARRIATWAADLRRRGVLRSLQFDTYHPEVGRFGTGPVLAGAEQVFAADSAAALAQLSAVGMTDSRPITAASLVDLVTAFTGSEQTGLRWLIEHVDRTSTPAPARDLHTEVIRLCDPADDRAAIRALPDGDQILTRWRRRRTAVAAYHDMLASSGSAKQAVLPDLLHLHCIRVAGLDRDVETVCLRLARAAAQSWINRGAR